MAARSCDWVWHELPSQYILVVNHFVESRADKPLLNFTKLPTQNLTSTSPLTGFSVSLVKDSAIYHYLTSII